MKVGETTEEIRFEDLDLIYMLSYDLGGPIEKVEDLEKQFSSKYKLTEAIWTPSSGEREFTLEFARRKAKELGIKDAENASAKKLKANERLMEELNKAIAMFRLIVSKNYEACGVQYLKLGRYVRLKLIDLNLRIEDPEFKIKDLDKELKCELYMLLHNTGVAVVTVWVHLNGDLSVDDVIEIEKKDLYEAKCTIKSPLGEEFKETTLDDFIYQKIITPLRDEIEKLRSPYSSYWVQSVICIRKYRCQDGCMTAEDVVEKHPREIYGILKMYVDWRSCRTNIIKEELKNLFSSTDYAFFVANMLMANEVPLFIGSTTLYEKLKSEEDQELAYREYELYLVLPTELLLLSTLVLDVYSSIYRDKFRDIKNRIKENKVVRPSEIVSVREELVNGLEEYNDILVFVKDPYERVMEHGKKGLSRKVNALEYELQELSDMARAFYEEESLRKQEDLSRTQTKLAFWQAVLTLLFGIFELMFVIPQALEFLGLKAIDIMFVVSALLGAMLIGLVYLVFSHSHKSKE